MGGRSSARGFECWPSPKRGVCRGRMQLHRGRRGMKCSLHGDSSALLIVLLD